MLLFGSNRISKGSEFQIERATTGNAQGVYMGTKSLSPEEERSLRGQLGSKNGDRLPASKQCQVDCARLCSYSVKDVGKPMQCVRHITWDRGVFRDNPNEMAGERKSRSK